MKTTSGSLLLLVAAVISAAVVLASAYLYHAQPARPWPYALAILVMASHGQPVTLCAATATATTHRKPGNAS